MSKIKLSKYFVFISIITFLAIFFFVVSQSYNNLMQATKENENNPLTQSISADLDINILDEIEKRQELPSLSSQTSSTSSSLDISGIENDQELIP